MRPRALRVVVGTAGLATLATIAVGSAISAHSPHDNVADIQFVANESKSDEVVGVVRGRLMRSSDRGETWTEVVNGLGGDADPVELFAFATNDPEIGYVVETSGTVLRTDDHGRNWSRIGTVEQPIRRLEVSPTDSDLVLALGARASFRSGNGGRTWKRMQSQDRPIVDASFLDGRALVGADEGGHAVASDDGGETWSVTADLAPLRRPRALSLIPQSDAEPMILVGGANGELMRSDNGGDTFEQVGDGLPTEEIRSIAASGTDGVKPTLWLTTWSAGPYRSTDLGATWSPWQDGLTTDPQAVEKRQPNWNTIAPSPGDSRRILLGGSDGLFALDNSDDRVWRQIETLDRYVAGLAVSPDFADDRVVVVTSYVRGAFRSNDGGEHWIPVNRGLEYPDNPSSSFPVWRLHNVHMSPDFANDDTVFSSTWRQVVRSTDGGHSWNGIALPKAPDGSVPRLFVVGVSPDFGADATIYAGTSQGAFYRSFDGGDPGTWEALSLLPSRIRSLSVGPATGDGRTILAGTAEHVYRSVDDGSTWVQCDTGIGAVPALGVQVMLSPEFESDGTALAAADGGLSISRDGGATWARSTALEAGPVEAAAFSPAFADDGTMLVSIRGHGLRRSTDWGASFEPVGNDLIGANLLIADYSVPSSSPIQFSPEFATDRTVFASAQQEVLRSTDGGITWEILEFPTSSDVRAAMVGGVGHGNVLRLAVGAGVVAVLVLIGTVLLARRWTSGRSPDEA